MDTDASQIKLANGWPLDKVRKCLTHKDTHQLVTFLSARFDQRFFRPIRLLRCVASGRDADGFGFSIMAICSLLIESIFCLLEGIPTTNPTEMTKLRTQFTAVPEKYKVNGIKDGRAAFQAFFKRFPFDGFFPEVDGTEFYGCVRNGLLHQAQTKNGWRIRTTGKIWDIERRTLNRNEFSIALERAFGKYLQELDSKPWKDEWWVCAARRIWWLIEVSKGHA